MKKKRILSIVAVLTAFFAFSNAVFAGDGDCIGAVCADGEPVGTPEPPPVVGVEVILNVTPANPVVTDLTSLLIPASGGNGTAVLGGTCNVPYAYGANNTLICSVDCGYVWRSAAGGCPAGSSYQPTNAQTPAAVTAPAAHTVPVPTIETTPEAPICTYTTYGYWNQYGQRCTP